MNSATDRDIVITGISGRFPSSDDINEFKDNLYAGVDMMTTDSSRWPKGLWGLPPCTGKIGSFDRFDAEFFGYSDRDVDYLDPQDRKLLEVTYEAILDAGLNPSSLKGSNTGVFQGSCFKEYHKDFRDCQSSSSCKYISNQVTIISRHFELKGPYVHIDTACGSSFCALNEAFVSMKTGLCDQAIVTGANSIFQPIFSYEMLDLKMISEDGKSKCMDSSANGYGRSEAVAVVFLQYAKDAKRIYATILNSKTNADGWKPEGVTFPGITGQSSLLKSTYDEIGLNPNDFEYIEAHTTGTTAGDPVELNAIYDVLCVNRSSDPLKVGCIKSNIGHSEGASGLCALIKSLFILQHKKIPPNLHLKNPNLKIRGLKDGKMVPVTKIEPFDGNIIPVNCFGFGGSNVHVVIQSYEREVSLDSYQIVTQRIPRLIPICGRTQESCHHVTSWIENNRKQLTKEFLSLLYNFSRESCNDFPFRSYIIISLQNSQEVITKTTPVRVESTGHHDIMVPEAHDTSFDEIKRLGDLYMSGILVDIESLYPKVEYPIPTCIPSLSPLIKWDHHKRYDLSSRLIELDEKKSAVLSKIIPFHFDHRNPEDSFLFDHVIDSRMLFPATGYLAMAWITLSKLMGHKSILDTPVVQFNDISIDRATVLNLSKVTSFSVRMIHDKFIIQEADSVVCTGRICIRSPESTDDHFIQKDGSHQKLMLSLPDVYKELRIRGYDYDQFFQGLHSVTTNGSEGKVIWRSVLVKSSLDSLPSDSEKDDQMWIRSWICLVDSMIQMTLFSDSDRCLKVPVRLESLTCDPGILRKAISNCEPYPDPVTLSSSKLVDCIFSSDEDVIQTRGLKIKGLKTSMLKRNQQSIRIKSYQFIPYQEINTISHDEMKRRIIEYHDTCITQSKKIIMNNRSLDIKINFDLSKPEHSLMKLLTDHINGSSRGVVDDLSRDILLGTHEDESYYDDRLIKPLFDVVTYNTINRTTFSTLNITQVMTSDHELNLNNKFSYLMDESLFSDQTSIYYNVSHLDEPMPDKQHLIVTSVKQNMAPFQKICNSLEDGAFVMVSVNNDYHLSQHIKSALRHLSISIPEFGSLRYEVMRHATSCGLIHVAEKKLLDSVNPITIMMFRKVTAVLKPEDQRIIEVGIDDHEDWMHEIQKYLKEQEAMSGDDGKRLWLTTRVDENNSKITGLIGFVKSLRLEPNGHRIRCLIDWSSNHKISFTQNSYYHHILQKDLVFNIIHDEASGYGSYEHVLCSSRITHLSSPPPGVSSVPKNLYLKSLKPGDLSSLIWTQSYEPPSPKLSIDVSYAALNFKDIMYATGKLSLDSISGISSRIANDSLLGIEFSGVDSNHNRVMGVVPYKGLSTRLNITSDHDVFLLNVPDDWSLEDAATVPVVYSTAFYGLVIRGQLRNGESVLIHSGSGGVGMAALNICLSYDCVIYTTVGSEEKESFLLKEFPKLNPNHIFSSRDTSFEYELLKLTNGRGVDVVLNSLSGDKMKASLRCLASNGRFIEVGKVDLLKNRLIDMNTYGHNITIHGVYPESFFSFNHMKEHYFPPKMITDRLKVKQLMVEGIRTGAVKPLKRTIYDMNHVEDAFRFMSTGKHVGKVVIKMSHGESDVSKVLKMTYFDSNKSYIVIGGLGGFGLELVQWMVSKGAKHIICNSRNGVKNSYHKYCLERMRESNASIVISAADSTTEDGIRQLIQLASKYGPVSGVFNAAAVFDDILFADQTKETFDAVTGPKVKATIHLDKVTRDMCLHLEHFVVFSSISAGRGNPGQTSYNFANSILDTICEDRLRSGLAGLSIQWGVIGDVGYVAEKSLNKSNTLQILGLSPQRITSCLDQLNDFMSSDHPVVTCYVKSDRDESQAICTSDVLKRIANILGLKDIQSVDPKRTFGSLGIDSLIAIEIQQMVEKIKGSSIPLNMVRELTLSQVIEMTSPVVVSSDTSSCIISSDHQSKVHTPLTQPLSSLTTHLSSSSPHNPSSHHITPPVLKSTSPHVMEPKSVVTLDDSRTLL